MKRAAFSHCLWPSQQYALRMRSPFRSNREAACLSSKSENNDVISLPFVIDSGASDVWIPADVFSTLRRTGTVSSSDIIRFRDLYPSRRLYAKRANFLVHSLRIGNIELRDVACSVARCAGRYC